MTNSKANSKVDNESRLSAGSTGERKSQRLLDIPKKGKNDFNTI